MQSNPKDSKSKRSSGSGLKAFFFKGRKKNKDDDSSDISRSVSSSVSMAGSVSRSLHSASMYDCGPGSPRTKSMGPVTVAGGFGNSRPQLNSSNAPGIYLPPPGAIKAPPPPPPVSSSLSTTSPPSTNATDVPTKPQSTSHKKSRAPLPPSAPGTTFSKSSFQLNRNDKDSTDFATLHVQSIPIIARSEPSLATTISNIPPCTSDDEKIIDSVSVTAVPPTVSLQTDSLSRPVKKKPPKPPPTSHHVMPNTTVAPSEKSFAAVFVPPPPPSSPPPDDLPTALPPWATTSASSHQHKRLSIDVEDKGVGVSFSDFDHSGQSSESDECTLEELDADLKDMIILGEEQLSIEDQSYKSEVSQFVELMQEMTSAHHERKANLLSYAQKLDDMDETPLLPLPSTMPPDISLLLTMEKDAELDENDKVSVNSFSLEKPFTTDKSPSGMPQVEPFVPSLGLETSVRQSPSSTPQVVPLVANLGHETSVHKSPSSMTQAESLEANPGLEASVRQSPSSTPQVESLVKNPDHETSVHKSPSSMTQAESLEANPGHETSVHKSPSSMPQAESNQTQVESLSSNIPRQEYSSENSFNLADSFEKSLLLIQIQQLEQQLQTWRDQLNRNQELLITSRLNQPLSSTSSTVLHQQVILQRQMIVQLEGSLRILRSQYNAPSEPIIVYSNEMVADSKRIRNVTKQDSLVVSPKSCGNDALLQEDDKSLGVSTVAASNEVNCVHDALPENEANLQASTKPFLPTKGFQSSETDFISSKKNSFSSIVPPSCEINLSASNESTDSTAVLQSNEKKSSDSKKDDFLGVVVPSCEANVSVSKKLVVSTEALRENIINDSSSEKCTISKKLPQDDETYFSSKESAVSSNLSPSNETNLSASKEPVLSTNLSQANRTNFPASIELDTSTNLPIANEAYLSASKEPAVSTDLTESNLPASMKLADSAALSNSNRINLLSNISPDVLQESGTNFATFQDKPLTGGVKRSARDFLVVRKAELPQFIPHRTKELEELDEPTKPVNRFPLRPSRHSVAIIPGNILSSTNPSNRQTEKEFQPSLSTIPSHVLTEDSSTHGKLNTAVNEKELQRFSFINNKNSTTANHSRQAFSRPTRVSLATSSPDSNSATTTDNSRQPDGPFIRVSLAKSSANNNSTTADNSRQPPEKEVQKSFSDGPISRISLAKSSANNNSTTADNSRLPSEKEVQKSFSDRSISRVSLATSSANNNLTTADNSRQPSEKEVQKSFSDGPISRVSLATSSANNNLTTADNSRQPPEKEVQKSFSDRPSRVSSTNISAKTVNDVESSLLKESLSSSSSSCDMPLLRRVGLLDTMLSFNRPLSMSAATDRLLQQKKGRTIYSSQKNLLKTSGDAGAEDVASSLKPLDLTLTLTKDEGPVCGIVSDRKSAFGSAPTVAPKPKISSSPLDRPVIIIPKEKVPSTFAENVTLRSITEPQRGAGRVIPVQQPTPREALMSALRESGGRIARPSSSITVAAVELQNGADF